MRLKVRPVRRMETSVMRMVTGITAVATSVVPQLCRKRKRITTESTSPKRMASHTLCTDVRTISDWS